jgi:hypothetical protein
MQKAAVPRRETKRRREPRNTRRSARRVFLEASRSIRGLRESEVADAPEKASRGELRAAVQREPLRVALRPGAVGSRVIPPRAEEKRQAARLRRTEVP